MSSGKKSGNGTAKEARRRHAGRSGFGHHDNGRGNEEWTTSSWIVYKYLALKEKHHYHLRRI